MKTEDKSKHKNNLSSCETIWKVCSIGNTETFFGFYEPKKKKSRAAETGFVL